MSAKLTLNKVNISGDVAYDSLVDSLFSYPYIYSMRRDKIYKLNILTGESINIASTVLSLSNHQAYHSGTKTTSGNKLFFILSDWNNSSTGVDGENITLYYVDIDTLKVTKVCRVYTGGSGSSASFAWYDGVIDYIEDNIIRLRYTVRNMTRSLAGSTTYKMIYAVAEIDLTDGKLTTLYTTSSTSSYISEPPGITDDEYKRLVYGCYVYKSSGNVYSNSVGFTYLSEPTTATTLNGEKYIDVCLFELGNSYYAIGGAVEGEPNRNLISISKDSLVSTKVCEIDSDYKGEPIAFVYYDRVYIVFGTKFIYTITLYDYKFTRLYKDTQLEESKTVTPTSEQQVVTPSEGYAAIKEVVVEAVESGTTLPDYLTVDESSVSISVEDAVDATGEYSVYTKRSSWTITRSDINSIHHDISVNLQNEYGPNDVVDFQAYSSIPQRRADVHIQDANLSANIRGAFGQVEVYTGDDNYAAYTVGDSRYGFDFDMGTCNLASFDPALSYMVELHALGQYLLFNDVSVLANIVESNFESLKNGDVLLANSVFGDIEGFNIDKGILFKENDHIYLFGWSKEYGSPVLLEDFMPINVNALTMQTMSSKPMSFLSVSFQSALIQKIKNKSKTDNSSLTQLNAKLRETERKIVAYADGEISEEEYQTAIAERKQLKAQLDELQNR